MCTLLSKPDDFSNRLSLLLSHLITRHPGSTTTTPVILPACSPPTESLTKVNNYLTIAQTDTIASGNRAARNDASPVTNWLL